MTQLNFTATTILSSLLDKSKTQTIRKAWEECFMCDGKGKTYITQGDYFDMSPSCDHCKGTGITTKPAKFKVGETVELVWDRDNVIERTTEFVLNVDEEILNKLVYDGLGKVKITEVEQVKLLIRDGEYLISYPEKEGMYFVVDDKWMVIKIEGFKSAEEMFTYFNEHYDLSQPRKFWVYRWEWIE